MLDDNVTAIIVAVLSGAIPGFFALRSSQKTKRAVQLAGSDVTVANWNKLIKNLYGEIERLNLQNEQDRKVAKDREHHLRFELEAVKQAAEEEKQELLAEIRLLRDKLKDLEDRVTSKLESKQDKIRP